MVLYAVFYTNTRRREKSFNIKIDVPNAPKIDGPNAMYAPQKVHSRYNGRTIPQRNSKPVRQHLPVPQRHSASGVKQKHSRTPSFDPLTLSQLDWGIGANRYSGPKVWGSGGSNDLGGSDPSSGPKVWRSGGSNDFGGSDPSSGPVVWGSGGSNNFDGSSPVFESFSAASDQSSNGSKSYVDMKDDADDNGSTDVKLLTLEDRIWSQLEDQTSDYETSDETSYQASYQTGESDETSDETGKSEETDGDGSESSSDPPIYNNFDTFLNNLGYDV